MDNRLNLLITVWYKNTAIPELVRIAFSVMRDDILAEELGDIPTSPDNYEFLHDELPMHIRNMGPIVKIEELFDVVKIPGSDGL